MKFSIDTAELFVPDGKAEAEALSRTTHMALATHQDDIEIMAYHGVLSCFGFEDKWFGGVIVTNGSGSPRDDLYADYTDDMMQKVRRAEQKKAAYVGEYGFQAMLDYPSASVKDPVNTAAVEDIKKLVIAARPEVIYTHNLADKHDTHVAVAIKTIQALRELPADVRPQTLLGCEVWRDLDWMIDEDKVGLDCAGHENLAAALLGVFDSQICGGKRYDLATIGRRRAHATYFASHGVDDTNQLNFAMNLTPLIEDPSLDIRGFVRDHIQRFSEEVMARIGKSL
ncbi:MAG: PIG-L family deacetylase [Armatimonadetes bacterium]|nr:PIG-L family deacetylase [Armatimonadota bacterium]